MASVTLACLALAGAAGGFGLARIRSLSRELAPLFAADPWVFPTRVYARPSVLRPGVRIEKNDLVAQLGRLGYVESQEAPDRPGRFRVRGSRVELFSRGSAQRLLRFQLSPGSTIESLVDAGGRAVDGLTLEPELLATLGGDNTEARTVLRLSELPAHLVQAVLAAEDRRFFHHHGVDPAGIARAIWADVTQGGIMQGASTITQQTVKNLMLGPERTWSRKLEEAQLALALDATVPKEKILETYLNEVYLGQCDGIAVCGMGEASRRYFGKDARDLTLAESALLAGLISSPSANHPQKHLDRAIARRNVVLRSMLDLGDISLQSYREASAETPRLAMRAGPSRLAPYFVQYVRKQLRESHSEQAINAGGLEVRTTLDSRLQTVAERSLRGGLAALEHRYPRLVRRGGKPLEAALVALDPATGEILAYVGGRSFADCQFDHVSLARRQPGSLFKPFVYLAGFERSTRDADFHFTPATLLDDSPLEIDNGSRVWAPHNYDGEFRGEVTVRRALEESINVPTVRASQQIGLQMVASVARSCGIRSSEAVYPSMVLGSEVVTPLQMAGAYTAIAEGGRAAEPFGIREVAERTGRVLSRSDSVSRPVVSEDAAYLTLDLMRGVLARGTAGRARAQGIEGDFAGKTGTTNDKRDAWFVGFSPDLLALVWVGYDDNAETGLSGAEGALAIWIDFMKNSGASPASSTFAEPSGIERVWIDPRSGERAGDRCPEVFDEVFLAGTGPVDACPEHASGEADGEILSALDVHDRLFHRWRPEAEPVAMGAAPR